MKTIARLSLIAASALAMTAGAAQAQGWTPINARQASLDDRIDAGVRSGDLSREEAIRLRGEFRQIQALEARYRSGGLSDWERRDLDRRMDALSIRVSSERTDRQTGPGWYGGRGWTDQRGEWVSINRRQDQLDRRIEAGYRSGRLTPREATRLRAEFNALEKLEARYRVNGLSGRERADLDQRFDRLAANLREEARDGQRYGYGYGGYDRR